MFRLFLPLSCLLLACGFVALPIDEAANSSRVDAKAADGRGGWLDMGSNDLGVLPAGEARYAGVAFVVPPGGDETARNCIVLGRDGAQKAVLSIRNAQGAQTISLLHATADAPAPETQQVIGQLAVRYEDGTVDKHDVKVGRDVSDWTSGSSFENAARAWTEYNYNTQVSLFASQFELDASKKPVKVAFAANGKCPWMIVAATLTGKKNLAPIRSSVEPTGTYKSPAPPPADLGRFPGKKPKNVILIIGDGMGQGAARLASYYQYGRGDGTYFQQLPVVGLCSTFSASAPVTDSAASATAFATGTKTSNGVLGLRVDGQHTRENAPVLTSVAARAHAKGRGVAILSSDPLFGATPAAYYAHVTARNEAGKICEQASECGYDVLVGAHWTEQWLLPEGKGGKRQDGRDLIAEMTKNGYVQARTSAEIAAAPRAAKVLGTLAFKDEESIGEAMKAVFGRLGKRSEGFFMMAECADTDHACHENNSSHTVKSVAMVEFMAKAAIDFARGRGDTLVVVTADHDTGHPTVIRGTGPKGRLVIQWSEAGHTKFPVPVHAYGPGAELFEGLIDNTDIAKNIVRLMGLDK